MLQIITMHSIIKSQYTTEHNTQLLEACDPENYANICFFFNHPFKHYMHSFIQVSIHPFINASIYLCIHPHADHLSMYSWICSLNNTSIHSTRWILLVTSSSRKTKKWQNFKSSRDLQHYLHLVLNYKIFQQIELRINVYIKKMRQQKRIWNNSK